MRTTATEQCPNRAEYIYGWAGQLKHACHRHTNAMAAISKAIGAPFSAEPYLPALMGDIPCEHMDDLEPEDKQEAKK